MSAVWSFYSLSTGIFTGATDSSSVTGYVPTAPAGQGVMAGAFDYLCQKVDLSSGTVVAYQPPAPPNTALATYSWDPVSQRWIATPTLAGLKVQPMATVQAAMDAAEVMQQRAVREITIAWATNATPPAQAVTRAQAINAQLVALRATMDAIVAAPDQTTLAAIQLP